jgi:hypothetical protein
MVFNRGATIYIDWIVERGNYQITILRDSGGTAFMVKPEQLKIHEI